MSAQRLKERKVILSAQIFLKSVKNIKKYLHQKLEQISIII